MSKKLFPPSRGWLHATLTMRARDPVDQDEVKKLCSGGKPDDYEFAILTQHCLQVKVVYRKLPEVAKREELAKLTPLCAYITRRLAPRGAQAVWHKDGPSYVFETWSGGAMLAFVRVNQLWLEDAEIMKDDVDQLVIDTLTTLSNATPTA